MYFYAEAAYGYSDKENKYPNALTLGSEVWLNVKILKSQEQNTYNINPGLVQPGQLERWGKIYQYYGGICHCQQSFPNKNWYIPRNWQQSRARFDMLL
jgi:hypothetical protein